MVRIQPPLGGFDRIGCGPVGVSKPLSRYALGALLAALLRRSIRFHFVASRSRELAPGPTSLLGKLFFSRRIATPRRSSAHSLLCSIRVRGAGGQTAGSMGIDDFPRHVRVG